MDTVRQILLAVEAKDDPDGVWMKEMEIPDLPDSSERRKHFVSMAEAGLFACEPTRSSTNPDRIYDVFVFDLSWRGHEYLDAIRDPNVWKKTKAGAQKAGNASFEFILELAKSFAKSALRDAGLPVPA